MQILDFTLTISPDMPGLWPGDPIPSFKIIRDHKKDGWQITLFTMTTHTGTHMDAPFHIVPERKNLTSLPIDSFVGEGVVIDVPCDEKHYITADDIIKSGVDIKKGDIVFLHTGWGAKWYHVSEKEIFNTRPGLAIDGAEYLVSKGIKAVGIDCHTISHPDDPQVAPEVSVHKLFMRKDIIIVEALTGLDKALNKRGILAIGALPLKDADGGPARVFGIFGI